MMVITDDVYGTFIKGFRSLMYVLPYNTICLYSFSNISAPRAGVSPPWHSPRKYFRR